MNAYETQRTLPVVGLVDVLEVKFTPEESERLHRMGDQQRRQRLKDLGLQLTDTYYWTNDSEGNVYYYEVI